MQDIKEFTLEELKGYLRKSGFPEYRAKQIFSWIYKKCALDFDVMSDLSSDLRSYLKAHFFIFSLKLAKTLKSEDGTEKFLFELKDKNFIEAVTIPQAQRVTACISTQVGCKFACSFCASGLSGFKRNLSSAEMLDEVLYLKKNNLSKKVTHVVFMGTGEPLDNYSNVLKATRIINSDYAFNIGARRITISTCGIIPGIRMLAGENLQIELSISLHAADEKTRTMLLPINKKYPLRDLIEACHDYIQKTKRQVTFEYILIKGVNSSLQDAENLSKIMKKLRLGKVNLIPSNIIEECKVEPPNKLEILLFKDYLLKEGVNVTLRKPRGKDIDAACGQLRLKYEEK